MGLAQAFDATATVHSLTILQSAAINHLPSLSGSPRFENLNKTKPSAPPKKKTQPPHSAEDRTTNLPALSPSGHPHGHALTASGDEVYQRIRSTYEGQPRNPTACRAERHRMARGLPDDTPR